jgi:hypothetical protein
VLHPIDPFDRVGCSRNQFQILDILADRAAKLMTK